MISRHRSGRRRSECKIFRHMPWQLSRQGRTDSRGLPCPPRGPNIGRRSTGTMPMTTELWQLDATDLARLIRLGRASAREATAACLGRLDAVNPKLNAVVRRFDAQALAAADAADAARARGEAPGPLHGVPVTVKVNTDQRGE